VEIFSGKSKPAENSLRAVPSEHIHMKTSVGKEKVRQITRISYGNSVKTPRLKFPQNSSPQKLTSPRPIFHMETDNSSFPEDCGDVDIPKDIITGPFNNTDQNSSLKFSWVFWE